MATFETHGAQHEGQWSPPQGYHEHQQLSDFDGSPTTNNGWNSPIPIPPKGWNYDSPSVLQTTHDAPELADPYLYDSPNSRPLSFSSQGATTLYSPRLQPVGQSHNEKTACEAYTAPGAPAEEPTICGVRKRVLYFILILIVVFFLICGLALGLGLGLGLKKKDSSPRIDPFCASHPEYCIGGALGEQYYSKKGAFNGSGIALAGESWNKKGRRIFTLFFQHWSGDIRFMQYKTDRTWEGAEKTETIATDAKDATAISAVAYIINSTEYVHLFYISKENKITQKTKTNESDIWQDGSINKLKLPVYDAPGTVGLQACYQGNFYGDSDAQNFPTATGEVNDVPFENQRAMNIWFAHDDSTFHQYAWLNGVSDDWIKVSHNQWLGKNTHAGVGCYSWLPGGTTYAMMVNKANETEIYWKDTANILSTAQHPLQSWQTATKGLISGVHPSTSLGYTTYFYAQMVDRSIKGFNITYQAENTTIIEDPAPHVISDGAANPIKALGGTHLTVTGYEDSMYVFYQTEGDDISVFTMPLGGGQWSPGNLTIPGE